MLFTDIISKKRDGGALSDAEIELFVDGLSDGGIPPEQVAALAMAIYLRSMTFTEAAALTRRMAASGTVLDWPGDELDGPVIDKHSTGGIGDKVSLVLAPVAAACGCYVPMISGRGLGHTGGTLDKMESIPGYCATPDLERFRRVVREVGCAIIGPTPELAPADGRLYAIRDVTATVESIPLITASILAKKIAAGNQALVLDVKVGNGAFMTTIERARELALSIMGIAKEAGLITHALITDMNETLGSTAGNALEVGEAIAWLRNESGDARFDEVSIALAAEMLVLGGREHDRNAAAQRARAVVNSGAAAEVFARMTAALGGPKDFVERPQHYLPSAPVRRAVTADRYGFLVRVDARALGHAIIELGGGRREASDRLDLTVGFSNIARIGDPVDHEHPLAVVHAASSDDADAAIVALRKACLVDDSPPTPTPVIHEILSDLPPSHTS